MLKAIKIRLYPNKTQEIYINKLLGCNRLLYNLCLDLKKKAYEDEGKLLGLNELSKYYHGELTKSDEYNFLNEHNTKVLQQSILNLMDAYSRFFKKKSGYTRFKSKNDNEQRCRFPAEAISKCNNYLSYKLSLTTQLKNIKFICSEEYVRHLDKYKRSIKSATLIKNKANQYYLSILVDGNIYKQVKEPTTNIIGIDLGIKSFITTDEGKIIDNIKIIRNNEFKLKKLHKQLSKKAKGSKNRNKSRIKLAKYHIHLTNIKRQFMHDVSNLLINENQIISIEDLNIKGMIKNHNLAKAIQEISIGEFIRILKYKVDWYGRVVVNVSRWFPSSKKCSSCGSINHKLRLKDREWVCKHCGSRHDWDINAAINIRNEGLRIYNELNSNVIELESIKV